MICNSLGGCVDQQFHLFIRSTQPSTLRGMVKWVVTHLHGLRKVWTLVQLTGIA